MRFALNLAPEVLDICLPSGEVALAHLSSITLVVSTKSGTVSNSALHRRALIGGAKGSVVKARDKEAPHWRSRAAPDFRHLLLDF